MTYKISAAPVVSGLMLTTVPAGAVSFHSEWQASRNNTPGVSTRTTNATDASQFCFLTSVYVEDTDSVNEGAQCKVVRTLNGFWKLEAGLGPKADDADVNCTMTCYNK